MKKKNHYQKAKLQNLAKGTKSNPKATCVTESLLYAPETDMTL